MLPKYLEPFRDPRSRDPFGPFPLDERDLTSVTNKELSSLLTSAPIIHQYGATKVVRLSENLALKAGGSILPGEAEILNLVASKTSIRVPRVHRSFQVKDDTKYFGTFGYIVMDYVPGQPLDECWNCLSSDAQGRIASQVAGMIQEMQSFELQNPGPIGGGPSRGRFFTDYSAGPFADTVEMEA
ncbi:Aminoglycoside phosphotransferase [Penicillium verhagenii]|uniref:Aminoglycoside phosphotransferase n=1 Tax=Penicillium verhagenii TaxID=1562060 RepID=UPI002545A081|nr:Aminoglycoside phosphotransferase [Penicillium verhagenii]KAJ5947938.1 Aminoglycoside phosphotransferase [Penicillium verhagenii]